MSDVVGFVDSVLDEVIWNENEPRNNIEAELVEKYKQDEEFRTIVKTMAVHSVIPARCFVNET